MTTTDLLFETFLHIPQNEIFMIKDANAQEIPISVKFYNGDISNFSFDESAKKISYEIIYDDDESEQGHGSDVKQVILIKEEFSNFKQGYDVGVLVNGMHLQDSSFDVDGSIPGENIIRIDIPYEEFVMMNDTSSDGDSITTKIELVSGDRIEFDSLDFAYDSGYYASVMWDSKSSSGKEILFTFSFFDQSNIQVKNILFAYSITDESGSEVWSNIGTSEMYLGVLAPHGIAQESIMIPTDGDYKIKLILTGQNSGNFESFMISDSSFSISSQNEKLKETTVTIPSWVRSNAG